MSSKNTLFVIFLWCLCAVPLIHSKLSADHIKDYKQSLTSQLRSGSVQNLRDIYYTILNLAEHGSQSATQIASKDEVCNLLKKIGITSAIDNDLGSEYIHLAHLFECPDSDLKSEYNSILKAASRGDKLADIHSAVRLASLSKSYAGAEVKEACSKVLDLIKDDGTAKGNRRAIESSVFNTARVLDTFNECKKLGIVENRTLTKLERTYESILENVVSLGKGRSAFTEGDFYRTTSSLVHAILSVSPKALKGKDLSNFVSYLSSHGQATETPERAYLYHRLGVSLKDHPVVRLEKNTLAKGKDNNLRARVSNIAGDAIEAKNLKVRGSLSSQDKDYATLNDIIFDKKGDVYEAKVSDRDIGKPGFYQLKLTVTSGDNSYDFLEEVVVRGTVKVESVKFDVTKSPEKPESLSYELESGEKHREVLRANQGNYIHLEVRASSAVPIGIIGARLVNPTHRFATGLVPAILERANKLHRIIIDLGDPDHILPYNGQYDLELVIAGDFVDANTKWVLANFDISFVKPATKAPANDGDLQLLPEIHHHFPAERRKPSVLITGLFDCLALGSVLVFLIALFKIGVNFGKFPKDFVGQVSALLFIVAILGLLTTLTLFWLKINIFETLVVLLLLTVPTVVIGDMALSRLNVHKEKAE